MTEKSLTERMFDILYPAYDADMFGEPISLMQQRTPTFTKPEIIFVSTPTGRIPREPEMQHVGVAAVDFETVALNVDFADIEARVLADTGIEDVLREAMTKRQDGAFHEAMLGRRYAPVPETGNRHERRARQARYRNSKP